MHHAKHSRPVKFSSGKRAWLVLNINNGHISTHITNEKRQINQSFHDHCGRNIQFDFERQFAMLNDPNPASVCCLNRKLRHGETVKIRIEIKNKTSNCYHLVLGYTELDPKELKESYPSLSRANTVWDAILNALVLRIVRKFDKEVCEGYLSINFTTDNKLSYDHSVGEKGKENLDLINTESEVLLVFELWGTSVEIIELQKPITTIPDGDTYQFSSEDRKIVLSESVRENFTYLLDNLTLDEFCDYLFQGQYLTRSEMEKFLKDCHSRKARKDFLLNIFSKRPISIKLLKQACIESKQEHIFEKLVETKKK